MNILTSMFVFGKIFTYFIEQNNNSDNNALFFANFIRPTGVGSD